MGKSKMSICVFRWHVALAYFTFSCALIQYIL